MKTRTLRIALLILSVIVGLQSLTVLGKNSVTVDSNSSLIPQPIRQGPLQTTYALGSYYWFQIGAIGDSNSYNVDGTNLTIRTVYDQVQNDAHSYWVGTPLSTGGFVQVGYLNELSTTGQAYCCAWFFETFYTPSCNCPPTIGPEGSAGPIGSWHTYSMVHVGNGVWAFYMDGQLLGKSPPPSDPNYLGASATSSGSNAPAGIAEVAQAIDNKDIIGPAEFRGVNIRQGGPWHQMSSAQSHCCFGFSSRTDLLNPYGVVEVESVDNDFLAGSKIPADQRVVGQLPAATPLWPTSLPLLYNRVTFAFTDDEGASFVPPWISITASGGPLYYTDYTKYTNQVVPQDSKVYTVTYISWHSTNVANSTQLSSSQSQVIPGNIFSVPVQVKGKFYGLPVAGATVLTFLPDSTNETVITDGSGTAKLVQLPSGNYSLRVKVPFGVSSVLKATLMGPASISLSVFSIAELLSIIVPPIAVAVAMVFLALRREQARRAALPISPPFPITIPAAYCGACGKPLGPAEFFCTTCGTPRAGSPQPLPPQQFPASSSAPPPPSQ